jgi:hypothetical protein
VIVTVVMYMAIAANVLAFLVHLRGIRRYDRLNLKVTEMITFLEAVMGMEESERLDMLKEARRTLQQREEAVQELMLDMSRHPERYVSR